MTDKFAEKLICELSQELRAKFPDFNGIYLFGSRARGDYNENSDYDLALVFDRKIEWKFKDEISSIVWNYMIKYLIIIDSLIFGIHDLINPISPLRENIKKEGLFYGK